MLCLLGAVFALGLLAGLFVLLTGLPDRTTAYIEMQIQKAGFPIHFDSIRLSTRGRGWVLGNARLYSASPDILHPVFSARKLYVHAWPADWKNPGETDWQIRLFVNNADLSLPGFSEQDFPEEYPIHRIRRMRASITAGADEMTLNRAALEWAGMQIRGKGHVSFSPAEEPVVSSAALEQLNAVKDRAIPFLRRFRADESPDVFIQFRVDSARLQEAEWNAEAGLTGFEWDGHRFGPLSARLAGKERRLRLEHLTLEQPDGGRLRLKGEMNFETKTASLSASGSVSAENVTAMLPGFSRSALEQNEVRITGSPDLNAVFGPSSLNRLFETAEASVSGLHVRINDFDFSSVSFRLTRDGSRLDFRKIDSTVEGEMFSGRFKTDLDRRSWEAVIKARCNPAVAGMFSNDLSEFISRFSFSDRFPDIDLFLSQTAPGEPLLIDGTVITEPFRWSDVPIETGAVSLLYSNRVLKLDPVHLQRRDAQFTGSVQIDFPQKSVWFDAASSFPPSDMDRVVFTDSPVLPESLRFEGPVYAEGRGLVDYGEERRNNFKVDVRGEQIGWGPIRAGAFQGRLRGRDARLELADVSAQLWGGTLEGDAEFRLPGPDQKRPWKLDVQISDADFKQMLHQISSSEFRGIRGTMSAAVRFSADAKKGFWDSVDGEGRAEIRDGHLADLPLLGGFSRLVQTPFPAFNLFSLTSFSADCLFRDGAVYSDNVKIGGALFSAAGKGKWSPRDGLDFIVRAEPLRQIREDKSWYQVHLWAADALKTGTSPFFRILEFRLEGTLDRPEWRLANVPAEIPAFFDGAREYFQR